MPLTKSSIASYVLRNVQMPEDSTTPSTTALSDVKNIIDEVAQRVYDMREWSEYIIFGTYALPASTQSMLLSAITVHSAYSTSANGYSAAFELVSLIRQGNNILTPIDPGSLNKIDPTSWDGTGSPTRFINRGQLGIFFNGVYSAATTLSFVGKAKFTSIGNSEYWILDPAGNLLVAGATLEFLKMNWRENENIPYWQQKYEAEVLKLIDRQEVQSANQKQIIPESPWTATPYGIGTTSPTGSGQIL